MPDSVASGTPYIYIYIYICIYTAAVCNIRDPMYFTTQPVLMLRMILMINVGYSPKQQ